MAGLQQMTMMSHRLFHTSTICSSKLMECWRHYIAVIIAIHSCAFAAEDGGAHILLLILQGLDGGVWHAS